MSNSPRLPPSPTLIPPRKSVELEDPGAHELSDAEEDVFADAQEDRYSHSRPSSPIPTTRVEKVDDRESHGEVPGTPAYKLRSQDAVPDEVEVVPEGRRSLNKGTSRPQTPAENPVPTTVVDKVDPLSPSHGDVPGTAAHSKRMADAVPDVIRPAHSPKDHTFGGKHSAAESPTVPTTMITKVDSEPSHGEVPGTEAYSMRTEDAKPDVVEKRGDVHSEPQSSRLRQVEQRLDGSSPIAADGGFGPMGSVSDEETETPGSTSPISLTEEEDDADEGFGDDFDDFEAVVEPGDFGEFDEPTETSPISNSAPPDSDNEKLQSQPLPVPDIPFPLIDFGDLDTHEDILDTISPYLEHIFPQSKKLQPESPPSLPSNNSTFLTERSHSLWSQLVAPPPLQPPNWVRSRIRRLFLVSLGVPVDLDEILPASKQKKLILPSIHARSDSPSPANGQRPGSRVRLKHENASSTSIDKAGTSSKSKRRKGPAPAPDLDLQATKMLCATTYAALANMTDDELRAHQRRLEELTARASEVLEYWLKRRDSALGDREAFEGVIENLVKHARRVRK